MVDLPSIPNRFLTTEAPQSAVSAGQVAEAYGGSLGRALDSLGQGLQDAAIPIAKQEAEKAVTVDANGNPQVQMMPPFTGKAGEVYNSIAKQRYLADSEVAARQQILNARTKYDGDPAGFQQWLTEYTGQLVGNQPDEGLANATKSQVTRLGFEVYQGMQLAQHQRDITGAKESLLFKKETIQDQLTALYRQGADPESDAVASRYNEWLDTQKSLVANPVFNYSKAQSDYEVNHFTAELMGNRFVGQVESIYKDQSAGPNGSARGGYQAALNHAQSILTDETLTLKPTEREAFYHKAVGEIRLQEAERKSDLTEARAAVRDFHLSTSLGAPPSMAEVENLAQRFRKLGAPGDAAGLYASIGIKSYIGDAGKQPLDEQAQQLRAIQGGPTSMGGGNAGGAVQFFQQKGLSREQAAGFVGNLLQENYYMDPNLSHDGGKGIGLAGWNEDRRAALQQFAAARGKTENDFQTQLDFAWQELNTTEKPTLDALKQAKTPGEAARIAQGYFRPGTPMTANRVNYAEQLAGAGPAAPIVTKQNLAAADQALSLNPQERALYERHLSVLSAGGVKNSDGSVSTLFQASVEHDGKTYNIPTVWDGKIVPVSEAVKKVDAAGWDKFPSYATEKEAEARYQQMHTFMEKDVQSYLKGGASTGTISPETTQFLTERVAGSNVRVDGANPEFASRLQRALTDAEAATGQKAKINSVVRTNAEQAAAYQRYQTGQGGLAAAPGHSRHERGAAADIAPGPVLDWLHQNAGKYGLEFLPGDAFRKDPVHIQMAGDAGGGGMPAGLAGTPTGTAWQAIRAKAVSGQAEAAWKSVIHEWDTNKVRPADVVVSQIVDAARVSGDLGLLAQVEHDMGRVDTVQQSGTQSLPQQAAVLTQGDQAAATGNMAPGDTLLRKELETQYNAIQSGLKDEPIRTTLGKLLPGRPAPAPLDTTDSAKLQQGLAYRAQIAQIGTNNWKPASPLPALDKTEIDALHGALATASPVDKARIFGDMAAALPEDVRNATFHKLGEKDPQAMTEAYAGALYSQAPDVAIGIVRGLAAMKADERNNPLREGEKKVEFTDALDKVLPQDAFSLASRTNPQGAYSTMRGAAVARYADLTAQDPNGKKEFSEPRLQQAVTEVSGGILEHNGGHFIAPRRGMGQSDFESILGQLTDADLPGVMTLQGQPVTAEYLRNSARLESVGDGRYLVQIGVNPAAPIYAVQYANTPDRPMPFVLDMRGMTPKPGGSPAGLIENMPGFGGPVPLAPGF